MLAFLGLCAQESMAPAAVYKGNALINKADGGVLGGEASYAYVNVTEFALHLPIQKQRA